MVFVPLEGNLTPEEQHAKMMERLNEMESGPKQQKPGEGRKTNNAMLEPEGAEESKAEG